MHIFTVAKEICVFLKNCWAGEHYFDVSIPTIFLSFLKTISILSKIFSFFLKLFLVLSWWALVWLMHSRAGCQYHQQAINSSQYHHCLLIIVYLLQTYFPNQTNHTKPSKWNQSCKEAINSYQSYSSSSQVRQNPPGDQQTKYTFQTKPTLSNQTNQGDDQLAASNAIINTPRPDKTPPSQKLWIFKQFNFSGNKSSFGRQRNAQNTQPWHLNKLRPKENSQLLDFARACT